MKFFNHNCCLMKTQSSLLALCDNNVEKQRTSRSHLAWEIISLFFGSELIASNFPSSTEILSSSAPTSFGFTTSCLLIWFSSWEIFRFNWFTVEADGFVTVMLGLLVGVRGGVIGDLGRSASVTGSKGVFVTGNSEGRRESFSLNSLSRSTSEIWSEKKFLFVVCFVFPSFVAEWWFVTH